jgi:hypothetical protein
MNHSSTSFGVALRGGPGGHFFCYQLINAANYKTVLLPIESVMSGRRMRSSISFEPTARLLRPRRVRLRLSLGRIVPFDLAVRQGFLEGGDGGGGGFRLRHS